MVGLPCLPSESVWVRICLVYSPTPARETIPVPTRVNNLPSSISVPCKPESQRLTVSLKHQRDYCHDNGRYQDRVDWINAWLCSGSGEHDTPPFQSDFSVLVIEMGKPHASHGSFRNTMPIPDLCSENGIHSVEACAHIDQMEYIPVKHALANRPTTN